MKETLKLKEIVVMAMLSALMGVVFMGLDSVYQPITTIAGPWISFYRISKFINGKSLRNTYNCCIFASRCWC
ncbi:ABC-type cobalt transport system, permease component family protein [Clostridium botulinum]|nr:ABC-type cobalt transport system, permease component family protein [Clostridium botulinum]